MNRVMFNNTERNLHAKLSANNISNSRSICPKRSYSLDLQKMLVSLAKQIKIITEIPTLNLLTVCPSQTLVCKCSELSKVKIVLQKKNILYGKPDEMYINNTSMHKT